MVGDPSFKDKERVLKQKEEVAILVELLKSSWAGFLILIKKLFF